jgi:acyl carrier protein
MDTHHLGFVEIVDGVKKIILAATNRLDLNPDDLQEDAQLINNPKLGLTMDSLDAVEIAMMIQKQYGVRLKDISSAKDTFQSVHSLALHIQSQLPTAEPRAYT